MHPAIEGHARACLITDGPQRHAVPVALRYDPGKNPRAVRLVFPPDVSPDGAANEWVFDRALLEAGLNRPAETENGDVRVWPCGRVQAVMELRSPQGTAVIQFDRAPLRRFLERTHAVEEPAPAAPEAAR
ncbi:SsgA family sporulation/cell division regulator [Streptomyces altiplanensis]